MTKKTTTKKVAKKKTAKKKEPLPPKPTKLPPLGPRKKYDYTRGPGQPTKYRPEFCDVIIQVAEKDDPFNYACNCCVELGISRETLHNWRETHPAFFDAYKRGIQIWESRINKFSQEAKMDYRYYRSFMWQVKQEVVEPAQETNHNVNIPSLEYLQELNKD